MNPFNINIVILISAKTEWQEVKNHFTGKELSLSPFGEYFSEDLREGKRILFFQSGWGKMLAAASTQYVIDKWNPGLIVNIGTCGGFYGHVDVGTIILVDKTIVYDIVEQMGDPEEAIDFFTADLDLSWLNTKFPLKVKRYTMLSADRDIIPSDVPGLIKKYRGIAADWESGAIAFVASQNQTKCLILRGVTDLVGKGGGEAYDGELILFKERTKRIMEVLIQSIPHILEVQEI